MKYLSKIILVLFLALLVTAGGNVFAQGSEEPTPPEGETAEGAGEEETTVEEGEGEESPGEESEVAEEVETPDLQEDEGLSEEETEKIIEESPELGEGDVENLGDLEGEVIAVTDDVVIIEQPDGQIIVVNREVYEGKTRSSGSSGYMTTTGSKVETGKVDTSGESPQITTKSGTYKIPSNVSVTRKGVVVSLDDIEHGEEAVAVLDKEGNLVALELVKEIEKASNTMVVGSLLAVALIALFAWMLRKKKTMPEMPE